MDLIDLLSSDVADLPRPGEQDLEAQLGSLFSNYSQAVARLNARDPSSRHVLAALPRIQLLGKQIIDALGSQLDALPGAAMASLDHGINAVQTELSDLTSIAVTNPGPLFRIRTGPLSHRFTPSDLFHIPFEHRDRVSTQRYSFPGLPCLYFGRSIYVCWEECGRPELATVWASKFVVARDESLRVIDFGLRPGSVAAMLDHHHLNPRNRIGTANAVLWPLIAACSIRRRQEEQRGFVQQYVIPQLLLRWVIEQWKKAPGDGPQIDGIRYFSTHVDDYNVGIAGMNCVFPSQRRVKSGFCPTLKQKFLMTPPINWQIATAASQQSGSPQYNDVEFELSPGWPRKYHETVFSRVEGVTDGLRPGPVP